MKKEHKGAFNKVLEINLTKQEYTIYKVKPKERKMYLGAKGLALKLLYDRMKPRLDPLGPDNYLAFMMGPLLGSGAPCSGRFSSVTKSPLTGIFTHSSCGGPFGMELKTAGYDGVLVYGKAKKRTYLLIDEKGVQFKDASKLWGMDTVNVQKELGPKGAALVIGPAGENLVSFANIASGHRFLGRGGAGAVMGSKNLKAVLAIGGAYKIVPVQKEEFAALKKVATKYINSNDVTSNKYRNYGTTANVRLCNEAGILPVKNFKTGQHVDHDKIAGETVKAKYDTKHATCRPCTILCGKKGTFAGKELIVSEYETVGLMGSNLGIFDPVKIAIWNKVCGDMGMDTISAGNVIGWVMEATEKGLVKSSLKFGKTKGIDETLRDMALRKDFGKEMGQGTKRLADKYGGKEFAIQVKGLEMAAYDPRGCFGQGLSYAVANRGACHLSTAIFAMETFFHLLKPYTVRAKADFVKFFENLNCCINSVHTCQFTAFAYTLEVPLTKYTPKKLLGGMMQHLPEAAVNMVDFSTYTKFWSYVTGVKISNAEFMKAGERIHILERYMNTREGITKKDDTLPLRFLKEPRESDKDGHTVPLDAMLPIYYKVRGYDKNGVPKKELLKKLGILN
jgi:aldehyde:ferredoxin oxidoreductase